MNIRQVNNCHAMKGHMKRRGASVVAAAAAFALTACTSLSVVPDRVVSANPARMALSGTPYALPMLQYDIEVSRILSDCPRAIRIPGSPIDGQLVSGQLDLELAATANPELIPGERYLVNHSKLDGWFKTTNFQIEYHPGTEILKGVNVSVEDQTGEVAASLVKAGLTVAAAASGPAGAAAAIAAVPQIPLGSRTDAAKLFSKSNNKMADAIDGLPSTQIDQSILAAFYKKLEKDRSDLANLAASAADPQQVTIVTCGTAALADVDSRKALGEQMKGANEELKAANDVLEKRTKIAEAGGLNAAGRSELGKALQDVLDAQAKVAGQAVTLGKIEKRIGAKKKAIWPRSFAERENLDLASMEDKPASDMAGLLTKATVRVIDDQKFANALAASGRVSAFRAIADDFVSHYVDENGKAKTFKAKDPLPKACLSATAGDVDPLKCIKALAQVSAQLKPVATDWLPGCAEAGADPLDCRSKLADSANGKIKDFPRQIDARGEKAQPGLFVRPPVRAELTICRATFRPDAPANTFECAAGASDLISADRVLAPQLGQLRFLRLVNEVFSNNAMSLSLSKEGAIEKFQYGSSSAVAKTLANVTAQGADFYKQRRDEYRTNTDDLTRKQKEIALIEATQKLEGFAKVPVADPMKAIAQAKAEAEVELLRAQINDLNARAVGRTAP